jgi:hypothetical protein
MFSIHAQIMGCRKDHAFLDPRPILRRIVETADGDIHNATIEVRKFR